MTLNGMKTLASGAAYAHEMLIGDVMPLAPDQLKGSITCVIPLNLAGLSLWSRQPFNHADTLEFDRPLTYHFDESDCMLVFQDVKVPWEKVIVHDNPALSRNIYIEMPMHAMANHQCNVRFGTKLKFMLAIASLVTQATGARDIPAVRDTLGRLAAMEAGYNAMTDGQIEANQPVDHGFVLYNRRYLYAALHWAMENHSVLIDILRELTTKGSARQSLCIRRLTHQVGDRDQHSRPSGSIADREASCPSPLYAGAGWLGCATIERHNPAHGRRRPISQRIWRIAAAYRC